MKKLKSIEENLPSVEVKLEKLLDNTDKLDKTLVEINKRIVVLETSAIHDNQNSRIEELEEAIDTLSTTFSSLKTKKQEYFLDKGKKFMYVPKVSKLKLISPDLLETKKEFNEFADKACNGLLKFSSQELPKIKSPPRMSNVLKLLIVLMFLVLKIFDTCFMPS